MRMAGIGCERKTYKKRSWNPLRNIGDRCGWNWSRICSCIWPMPSPTVRHGDANMTFGMPNGWCDGCSRMS